MISNRKTGDRVEQAVFLLLIALSLALDAFAVSVSSGVAVPGFGPAQALKLGVWFGAFQFAMPLIGWLLGSSVSGYIQAFDHWVAFGLLAFIGGRMVVFCLSVLGGVLGRRLGCLFQRRAELAGGIVLILIGVRILIEHLTGG